VVTGGVGIQGNTFFGGGLFVSGTALANNTQQASVNVYTGDINFNNGNLYANNTTASVSTTTGTFVVKGGMGISGNTFIGGAISALQYIESITSITWASPLTINFTNGLLIYFNTAPTGAITSLTILSVPTTPLCSYTFTFIITTTTSANYINTANITINSTSYSLKGTITLGTPTAYILQQITIMNISSSVTPNFIAFTTAQAY
jgi:hypothetical protein